MTTRDKSVVALVVALLLVMVIVWLSPSGRPEAPAQHFSLIDGQSIELTSLRGKPVLVTFWATTCPGCVHEIPHLIKLYQDYHARGLEIIGVAMAYDPPSQVLEMSQRIPIPYPVALDVDGSAALAFGDVRLTPTNVLIDPEGRIMQNKLGEYSEQELTELRRQIEAMLGSGGNS